MTANPLMLHRRPEPVRDLDEYARWLNSLRWVQASGKPYHVAQRSRPDGASERFLDRQA